MIGTVLDKYEVLQKVGEGGMATVYRGRHTTLGREVAIKVLHPHLSSSTRNRKRFAREARAIEHLKHANILEIFDYSGAETEDCYIVTEFVHGETLTDVMNRFGRMPSEAVAMIGADLARALAFAHENGILHRDLKPDNVMLRDDGTVKLMDFGIARFLDESQVTMTGALVGSPQFMSPEQAKEAELDPRSDLFSLGTVLFFLVTGHLPFAGNNPSVILKNIIEGNRPSVTELAPAMSASLADLIERLLASDKNDRFNTAAEVATHLDRCLAEVKLDRQLPGFTLIEYLRDPEPWSRRVEEHLKSALMDGGKGYLAQGDHLAALRLFNRLLSIDENNAQVLELVQGLHTEPTAPPRRSRMPVAVAAVLVAAAAAGVAVMLYPPTTTEVKAAPDPVAADSRPNLAASAIVEPDEPPETPIPEEADADGAVVKSSAARVPATLRPARDPVKAVREVVVPAPPPADAPGEVTFEVTPPEAWAKVFCGDQQVAGTRYPENKKEFAPGLYNCRYTSPLIFDDEFELYVMSGQKTKVSRPVRFKPFELSVDASCADDCAVVRDGVGIGTVASLDRVVPIERPEVPHDVQLRCGDRTYPQEYTGEPRGPLRCAP